MFHKAYYFFEISTTLFLILLLQNRPQSTSPREDEPLLTMDPYDKNVQQLHQGGSGIEPPNRRHYPNYTFDSFNPSSLSSTTTQQQQTTPNYPRSAAIGVSPQQIHPVQFYGGQYEYPAERSPYHGPGSSQSQQQRLPSSMQRATQEQRGPAPFASFEDLSLASFEMSPDEHLRG